MPGLYDHLKNSLGSEEPSGVTALDIADLPSEQRIILVAMLRDPAASRGGVTLEMLKTRVGDKVTEFEPVLNILEQNGWLIISGEAPNFRYRVNLRPKKGNNSTEGLWSLLSGRLSNDT